MKKFPIGVMLDSFRLPFNEALDKAVSVGASGFQFYVVDGEFSPDNFPKAKRREIIKKVKDKGLVISALCGETGKGLWREEENDRILEFSKKIFDMCEDLETRIVTAHVGVIPEDKNSKQYAVIYDALGRMGKIARSCGAKFAIETGPEKSEILRNFLLEIDDPGIGVNLDPANLKMVAGDDSVTAVRNLADFTVHTHAKDGKMIKYVDPMCVYCEKPLPEGVTGPTYEELPLGEGDVGFPAYLEALSSSSYNGFLTIEREVGEDPEKDIRLAVDFLKKITGVI